MKNCHKSLLTRTAMMLLLVVAGFTTASAAVDFLGHSAIDVNGTWYYTDNENHSWCTGGDFNGANLGTFANTLPLGGQSQTWENGNVNWNGGHVDMYYKIDNEAAVKIQLDYYQFANNNNYFQSGGSDFTSTFIDISGLSAGEHTLAVWFECDKRDPEGSNNYVATFTVDNAHPNIGSIQWNSTLNAYEIKSKENLNDLAVYVSGWGTYFPGGTENTSHNCENMIFKMTANIEYDGTKVNNYTPIHYKGVGFSGTFDGQGHYISGININEENGINKGVFGFNRGTIKNLTVKDFTIVGYNMIGTIAADNEGTIENCHADSNVKLTGSLYVGGIVGAANRGKVSGCTSAATITASESSIVRGCYIGGITGEVLSNSTLKDNLFTGVIGGNLKQYIGSIVGHKIGTLTNNFYTNNNTGLGGVGTVDNAEATDVDGAKVGTVVGSKPESIGDAVTTYGEGDYVGIIAYEQGLFYNNNYYVPTPTPRYYLVGSMNSWAIDAAYELSENTETTGEYYIHDVNLTAGAQFKVVSSLDGSTIQYYYPDGMETNYVISSDGHYDIYFRPDGQGGTGWHYGCIYAEAKLVIDLTGDDPVSAPVGFFSSLDRSMYGVYVDYANFTIDLNLDGVADLQLELDYQSMSLNISRQSGAADLTANSRLELIESSTNPYVCVILKFNSSFQTEKLKPIFGIFESGKDGLSYPNSENIGFEDGETVNVMLKGRTLYKNNQWNTLVLPFNVDLLAAGCPLAGAIARPLSAASIEGTTLKLTFGAAVDELTAGTPYIIKWETTTPSEFTDPEFDGVTIDKTMHNFDNSVQSNNEQSSIVMPGQRVRFVGTYDLVTFAEGSAHTNVLFMGSDSKLYYPDGGAATTIGACRAYFLIGDDNSAPVLTTFNIDFGEGTTSLKAIDNGQLIMDNGAWYTIDGRCVANGQWIMDNGQLPRGVYIHNGKKVVIK